VEENRGIGLAPQEITKNDEMDATTKWKALFQARMVLVKIGTMEERRVCRASLKKMDEEMKKW